MTYEEYCNLRDSCGLTDYAVAKMAQVSRSALSQWKNGNSKPSKHTQERLDRFFSSDYFQLNGSEDLAIIESGHSTVDPSPRVAFYFIKLMDGTTIKLSADEYNKLQEAIEAFTYAWVKKQRSGT